jgi:hypothetical protein
LYILLTLKSSWRSYFSGAPTTAGVPDSLPIESVLALAGVFFVPKDNTVAVLPATVFLAFLLLLAFLFLLAHSCCSCVSTVADAPAVSIVLAVAGVPAIELYNKIKHITPSAYGYQSDNIFGYRTIEYRTGDSKHFRTFG